MWALAVTLWPGFCLGAPTGASADLLRVEVEFHDLPAGDEPLVLAHGFIDPGSLRVALGDSLLIDGRDVRLRGRSGVLVPLKPWRQLISTAEGKSNPPLLVVAYRFRPVAVPARLDLRPVGAGPGQQEKMQDVPDKVMATGSTGQLDVRGSKTIQVSSGSRRDMVVDQNLRLDISGHLTPDISVRAFLSDDNLPVVPEGNTQQLRDIDKVLVQLQGRGWNATLGDFVARRPGTVYGGYRRKLQGVTFAGRNGQLSFDVLAGSPRGRYRTLQIKGEESNQGPYFLGGGDGSGNLFIVAGSERVSLDGISLVRGSDRDYVIDYVRGSVTFTYHKLITAESSIVVEFEEGEGPYGRTVTGAGAGLDFTVPGLVADGEFRVRMISEKDDPGRLRTGTLGPEDEATLASAGDDASLAIAPGAVAVPDSNGTYNLVEDAGGTHYVAAPASGAWDVSFYYVGIGLGDYDLATLDATGARLFVYRGEGLGTYRVGRPLDLPVSHSMMSMTAAVGDTAESHLQAEWDVSQQDLNRLSQLDDGDDQGHALRLAAAFAPRELRLAGRSLGRVHAAGSIDDLDATFRPFELVRDVFSYRRWGLEERARRVGFLQEADRQTVLRGGWEAGSAKRQVKVGLSRNGLDHGGDLTASLTSWTGSWRWGGFAGTHLWNEATAADRIDPLDIASTLRRHEVSWRVAWLRPSINYGFQRWRDAAHTGSGSAGFRQEHYGVGLVGDTGRALTWNVAFQRDLADSLQTGTWGRQRDGRTTRLNLTTGQVGGMRLVGEGTLRRIRAPGKAEQTTRLARTTVAGKWDRTGTDFTLGYRVDNSRTEVLDRQIVFVGDRQGDYDQDGRFLGLDLGAYDVVLAGTDSLVATTAVRADLNWRQEFVFLGRERWFGAWSVQTLASVEGRSTTDDVGSLLRLDPGLVLRDSSTVLGDVSVTEEMTLLKNHPGVDLRGKFEFRQTRDRQFASHPEDRLQRTWQVRGSVRTGRTTSWQARFLEGSENRSSTEDLLSARRSIAVGTRTAELGWVFSPGPELRLNLQGEYTQRSDAVSEVVQNEWAGHPTVRSRLHRAWTLQGDVRAGNVSSREPPGAVRPWFFPTQGVKVDVSMRLAWEPTRFLTVAANWFARKEGERRWQHDFRLESTARF